jgi:hypothetical protein
MIRTITTGLLALTCAMPVTAITLESLPEASQEEIAKLCLPVQFKEGAAAYRNCVQSELDIRSETSTNSTELNSLSFDDRYAVQQACAKAGAESSGTYQTCVNEQIIALRKIKVPQLSNLSEDELDVIQQACFDAQSRLGAAAFRQCLNTEVGSLRGIPKVDLSQLSAIDKNALQLRCSAIASTTAEYRICLGDEHLLITGKAPVFIESSKELSTARSQSVSSQSATTPSASAVKPTEAATQSVTQTTNKPATKKPEVTIATLQAPASTISNETPAAQENKIVAALPRSIPPQRANTETDAVIEVSTATTPVEPAIAVDTESRVISKPGLAEDLRTANETALTNNNPPQVGTGNSSSLSQTAESTAQTNAETPNVEKALALWHGFLQKLGSLNRTGWTMLAALLAIPIILLGLFSIIRKSKRNAYQPMPRAPLSDRSGPELQSQQLRQEQEAAELFDGEDNQHQQTGAAYDSHAENRTSDLPGAEQTPNSENESAEESVDTLELTDPEVTDVESAVFSRADLTQDPFDFETEDNEKAKQLPSNFQVWLYQKPKDSQMRFCIDFLVYWMAYGDDRYDPTLKKRIFEARQLSDNDLIKRWVLQNDIHAFAEAVAWMRKNASQAQLEETIALLMALLITENSVTPVQNTLLRFLADAFNMGEDRIQQLFEAAFGHELPPMPRPDRAPWWYKLDNNAVDRWDSRKTAELPENEKLLIRLGLTEAHNESDIIQAFRRAAKRCHPDRFPHLSERERAMAEHRFAKFEEARDKLLGVSV